MDETTDPKHTKKSLFAPTSEKEEAVDDAAEDADKDTSIDAADIADGVDNESAEAGDGARSDEDATAEPQPADPDAASREEAGEQLVFALELADSDLANAVIQPRSALPGRWGAGGRICSVSDRYGDVPEVAQPLSRQIMGGAGFSARKTPPPVVDISAPSSLGHDPSRHPKPRRTYSAPERASGQSTQTDSDEQESAFGFAEFDDRLSDQQDVVIKRSDRLMKLAMAAAFVFVALVGVVAMTSRGDEGAPPEALALIVESEAEGNAETVNLPDSLTYTIDETDNVEGLNRSIDVTLSEPLTSAELETLATQLRGDPQNFARTFMGFVVEGQDDGWYWATVLFDPDMVVRIRE